MEKIILEGKVIYRSSKGKKVKFEKSKETFDEIVVKEERNDIVEVNA